MVLLDFLSTWPEKKSKTSFWWENKALLYLLDVEENEVYMYFCLFPFFHMWETAAKLRPRKYKQCIIFPSSGIPPPHEVFFSWWSEEVNCRATNPNLYISWMKILRLYFLEQWFSKNDSDPEILSSTLGGPATCVCISPAEVWNPIKYECQDHSWNVSHQRRGREGIFKQESMGKN